MLPRNPTDAVDVPKGYRGEITPFDREQVMALLDTAKQTQPRLYALYVLGVTTGMRQSELIPNPVEECLDIMPPGATSGSW